MKKFKKIFAVLLTLAMVLGMSMTSFAEEGLPSGTIKVENADGAELSYLQLVKPDTTKASGWTLTEAGKKAFDVAAGEDDQQVIWNLIKTKKTDVVLPEGVTATAYTGTEIESALKKVVNLSYIPFGSTGAGENLVYNSSVVVSEQGAYAIKAVDHTGNYTYSMMSAYISFEYNADGSASSTLGTDTINAKKQNTKVSKESNDSDKVVYVGKQLTYTIKATVPYFTPGTSGHTFKVIDIISGATFDKIKEGSNAGKVQVTAVGGDINKTFYLEVKPTTVEGEEQIDIDLADFMDLEANTEITITYSATVNGTTVTNKATPYHDDTPGNTTEEKLYTGRITMTKKDGDNADAKPLSGAKFKVYDTKTGKYATLKVENGVNVVTGWVDRIEDATETSGTNESGEVVVGGLEHNVAYQFKETTAPTGYSINEKNSDVSWQALPTSLNETNVIGTSNMSDTRLSGLPSTGGIGTTIFTIGGCAIMIIAAALFFASRRKAAK